MFFCKALNQHPNIDFFFPSARPAPNMIDKIYLYVNITKYYNQYIWHIVSVLQVLQKHFLFSGKVTSPSLKL